MEIIEEPEENSVKVTEKKQKERGISEKDKRRKELETSRAKEGGNVFRVNQTNITEPQNELQVTIKEEK